MGMYHQAVDVGNIVEEGRVNCGTEIKKEEKWRALRGMDVWEKGYACICKPFEFDLGLWE